MNYRPMKEFQSVSRTVQSRSAREQKFANPTVLFWNELGSEQDGIRWHDPSMESVIGRGTKIFLFLPCDSELQGDVDEAMALQELLGPSRDRRSSSSMTSHRFGC